MTTNEWRIKNYLDKHEIYKDNSDMQTIIINSFYNEHNEKRGRTDVNDDEWKDKLIYVQKHFGLFTQYANTWKQKINSPNEV